MQKILIVHAHPEPRSFNASLMREARDHFEKEGREVQISNLYEMNFNPVGGKEDFTGLSNSDFFKYQMEQVNAFQNNLFEANLKVEMDKLEWCDVLIFNFPLWWFGLPAVLKGWVDRVFAMGFVYGAGKGVYDNGFFADKTAFLTITTGGPEMAYGANGKNGDLDKILFPIQHGMFYFLGMTVLPPFISFSPARSDEDTLKGELERYRNYLKQLDMHKPLYTNR